MTAATIKNKMRTVAAFSFAMGVLLFSSSSARTEELPLFYEGIRPLGMGGAFTAVSDDENAMFYNPAGLNQVDGFGQLELVNPTLEVSQSAIDLGKRIKEIAESADAETQLDQTTQLLDEALGERFHLRSSIFPNLIFHNFGIGVLAQGTGNGAVHNPLASNTIDLELNLDLAVLISGAYRFDDVKGHPLQVGVTAKGVSRQQIDKIYTTREIAEQKFDIQKELNKEVGVALDIGFLYPIPVWTDTTFGLSLQNIVGGDLGAAGKLPQQVNIGVALRPEIGFGTVLLAADIMDIAFQAGEDNDIGKRLHFGAEYRLPVILSFRTGLYQGYPSFGTTMSLWLVRFSYAYYIEEIGAFAGQTPDPRHVAQLSVGF